MNALEFIVSLLHATAWPAVVLVLAFVFRSDLAALLGRISALKHKDTELQFGRELALAAEEVNKEKSESQNYLSAPEARKTLAILDIDPNAAVIAAWVEFEGAARAALPSDMHSAERTPSMPQVIAMLVSMGALDTADADFLRVLRRLRNSVLHLKNPDLDQDTAYKAITALLYMARELRKRVEVQNA